MLTSGIDFHFNLFRLSSLNMALVFRLTVQLEAFKNFKVYMKLR